MGFAGMVILVGPAFRPSGPTRRWSADCGFAGLGSWIVVFKTRRVAEFADAGRSDAKALRIVALVIGWLLGGEVLSQRTLVAAAVILTAVVLVITAPHRDPREAADGLPAPGEA